MEEMERRADQMIRAMDKRNDHIRRTMEALNREPDPLTRKREEHDRLAHDGRVQAMERRLAAQGD